MEYFIGAIFGAIAAGSLVGAIPAVCGAIKKRRGLAIGGFFACLIMHFILGFMLSVPVCIIFVILIFLTKPKSQDNQQIEIKTNVQTASTDTNLSVAGVLAEYKTLLDSGVITQEEYDKKKNEILGLEI